MRRKKIRSPFTDYFNFSSRERNGVLFLACILFILLSTNYYFKNKSVEILPADPALIAVIDKLMERDSIGKKSTLSFEKHEKIESTSYFNFDPNRLNLTDGKKLGLSEKQINVIAHYISRGGKFRVKSDFKKMYCISENEYEKLRTFLLLPDTLIVKKPQAKMRTVKDLKVNIQKADSVEFMELHGIGPVLASRIVRYREKLGGFYSIYQLKEVWGVNDSVFTNIHLNIYLTDSLPYRFIHINSDSFNILASHPYIKSKIAGLICNYRKQHKSFNSIEELKQLPLITEENFLKLAPYIDPIKNLKNE